jgi:hypothetical protein
MIMPSELEWISGINLYFTRKNDGERTYADHNDLIKYKDQLIFSSV